MERFKYLIGRFGMLIPFVLTVIFLFVSKSENITTAKVGTGFMWTFFSIFVGWLGYWLVRVGIQSYKTWQEIEDAEK